MDDEVKNDDIATLLRHFAGLEGVGDDIKAIELAAADELERLRTTGDALAQALEDIRDVRLWIADLIYEWQEARRG